MRTATTAAAVVLALTAAIGAQEKSKDPTALPKKGDAVVLNGCLRGGALEATDMGDSDTATPLLSGLTFRLTGKKDLLKDLKQKHDGKLVEIRGTLKSDLQPQSGLGANLGRMRVTIGAGSAGPSSPNGRDAEARRSVPVVELTAFDGGGTGCSR